MLFVAVLYLCQDRKRPDRRGLQPGPFEIILFQFLLEPKSVLTKLEQLIRRKINLNTGRVALDHL